MKSELQQLLINDLDELAGRSYLMEKKKIDESIIDIIFDSDHQITGLVFGSAALCYLLFFVIRFSLF